jgi:hypothetical protein
MKIVVGLFWPHGRACDLTLIGGEQTLGKKGKYDATSVSGGCFAMPLDTCELELTAVRLP